MFSLLLLAALKKAMNFRSDGHPQLRYFYGKDFGVSSSKFSFLYKGHVLRGERFFASEGDYKGVVVFFHGMGAGYTAYSQEIAYFALHGYLVYAYDYLGCMTSEGSGIGSICEPVLIQKEFFAFLDQDEPANGLPRFAVGHSWGGYAALASAKPEYRIEAIVSIAGFVSAVDMVCRLEPKLEKFRFLVKSAFRIGFGKVAVRDITDVVANSHARVLYIQGDKDTAVLPADGIEKVQAAFPNDSRVQTRLVPGAGHNPYWTKEGQEYIVMLVKDHQMMRRDFDNQFEIDYARLNCDDPAFMQSLLDFLENVDKPNAG